MQLHLTSGIFHYRSIAGLCLLVSLNGSVHAPEKADFTQTILLICCSSVPLHMQPMVAFLLLLGRQPCKNRAPSFFRYCLVILFGDDLGFGF